MASNVPESKPDTTNSPSGFIAFFKTYLNGWVAAAVVLPTVITMTGLPIYEAQRAILVTYTSLSCVLTLAFLFHSRNLLIVSTRPTSRVGSAMLFALPLTLLAATGFCGYQYIALLSLSVHYAQKPFQDALKFQSLPEIHEGTAIILYYILTVLFAETALFVMAFREWRPSKD